MVEIELVFLAALDRTSKDTQSEARSYCEWLVRLSFLDCERDEGFTFVPMRTDTLVLSTSGKGT